MTKSQKMKTTINKYNKTAIDSKFEETNLK